MSKCLSCGKEVPDFAITCVSCQIKYGGETVNISQEEYQKLRYKETLYDAMQNQNEDLN